MTLELTGSFKLLISILIILALVCFNIIGWSVKYWREKRREKKFVSSDKTLEERIQNYTIEGEDE